MSKKERVSIGGQALIEGILMRGPKCSAVALRLPDGSIEVEEKEMIPLAKKYKFFALPLIRGIAGYIDSMVFGYKCLMESAEKTSFEDIKDTSGEEEMSKVDKWITDHFGEKMVIAITTISAVLGVALSVLLFMYLPAQIFNWINGAVDGAIANWRGLIEGSMRMAIFVGYMVLVSRMKDIKRMFMYHGAEHKSIFCFEKGLELTVENVKEQSRFHPRCGTSFLFVMIILSVVVSSLISIIFPAVTKNIVIWMLIKLLIILPLVMGLGYEFIRYAGCHENLAVKILSAPGLWMQRITTNEPTDDIIEVGIASLKAALYGVEKKEDEIPEIEVEDEKLDLEAIKSENVVEDEEEIIKVIEEETEEQTVSEENQSDISNQSVDEIMAEIFKNTSFEEK